MDNDVSIRTMYSNRQNNLNIVKLLAAILVMVSHSYAYGRGYRINDWYDTFTHGLYSFGSIAVLIFFFYSGLLVTESMIRHPDSKRFFYRRAKRIYPAYALVLLIITFCAGPILSNFTMKEYFTSRYTYQYLLNLVFIPVHNLPGVFYSNAFDASVNGPIWTIRLEVICYCITWFLAKMKLLDRKKFPYTSIFLVAMLGILGGLYYGGAIELATILNSLLFVIVYYEGMMYAVYGDYIKIKASLFYGTLITFLILQCVGIYEISFLVCMPILLIYLAFATGCRGKVLQKMGDASYEIYLWGGFIGQLVTYAFGGYVIESVHMILTIAITIPLGMITKKALS